MLDLNEFEVKVKALRIRNLRSFNSSKKQPYIDIKPVTVFIGQNSCGKSTLLRTFPLLRQSIESRTSGPILWYGQYVDYGAFSEARNKNDDEDVIYFDYKFDIDIFSIMRFGRPKKEVPISIELGVSEHQKRTVARSVRINASDLDIEIKYKSYTSASVFVNGNKLDEDYNVDVPRNNSLIPNIYLNNLNSVSVIDDELDLIQSYESADAISRKHVINIINIIFKTKLLPHEYVHYEKNILSELNLHPRDELRDRIEEKYPQSSALSEEEIDLLYNNLLVVFLPRLLDSINQYFHLYTSKIKYIAPLRATAERFYRFQDLHVEELDHTGSNLAMLLRNFSKKDMKRFQAWSQENFGFAVSVPESDNLHYEIMIDVDGQTNNISDMGFGFSQILPIVTALWLESSRSSRLSRLYGHIPTTFVIEQPELHLHPKFQATLAKVFAKVALLSLTNSKNKIRIIFETHSKTMIDALGDFVEENGCNDIFNIVIFNKINGTSNVHTASFDKDGDLLDWPIGFFSGR